MVLSGILVEDEGVRERRMEVEKEGCGKRKRWTRRAKEGGNEGQTERQTGRRGEMLIVSERVRAREPGKECET